MAQNGENGINDGADERMLKDEEKQNLAKKDEVQFISGNQNGDAKIDIGAVDKVCSLMLFRYHRNIYSEHNQLKEYTNR